MWVLLSPILIKREGDGSFFLLFDKTQIFHKIKYDLMMPVLCYGEVVRFFKTLQYFDQITTLTYVHMDNFCPW